MKKRAFRFAINHSTRRKLFRAKSKVCFDYFVRLSRNWHNKKVGGKTIAKSVSMYEEVEISVWTYLVTAYASETWIPFHTEN